MDASVAIQNTRRKLLKMVIEKIKKSKREYLVNLWESNNFEKLFLIVNQPELYFLLKIQITKVKVICHKVIGDWCIWQGMLMNACRVSQSVFHNKLEVKGLIKISVKFGAEKVFYNFATMHQTLFWGT